MAQLVKKFIANNAVDEDKILLSNDAALRGRNAADSADVDIIKVNASDEVELGADLNMGTNAITNVGNVDGRDVSADGAALDDHLDGGANKHDATEVDYERADGSKKNIQAASDDVESALTDLDDAIGALAASPSNYTPTDASIVADHLAAIDSALASAGGNEFADDVFRIQDNGDATKEIAFEASAITTSTVRTITMPDADVDLGDVAANTSDIADLRTTQGTSDGDTDLGTFTGATISDNTTVKGALQELETAHETTDGLIDGHLDGGANKHDATEIDYERVDGSKKNIQASSDDVESALTDLDDAIGALASSPTNYTPTDAGITADHLAAIDSELGTLNSTISNFEWQASALDYITDNTVAPPTEVSGDRYVLSHDGGAPNADWDGASAGDIVEFNGTTWDAVTPTTGTFIAVDDEADVLYLWGGSSWDSKAFESTTASNGLTKVGFDIQLASSAAGDGLAFAAGVLSVNAGDGLEINTDNVQLDLLASGGLKIVSGEAAVEPADFAGSGLEDDGSDNLQINVDATNGTTEVNGSGELVALRSAQEVITLDGTDITNQYVDLAAEAHSAASITVTPVGGPLQEQGVDYTVSLTGGAGGVTRVSFAGDLATGGDAELVATDKLVIKYEVL